MKPIQATPTSVNKIFSTHEFIIPDFQRSYSWDNDNCSKLWDDIVSFYESLGDESDNQTYFLGNIVVYQNSDFGNRDVWDVIDGQQRLTTLMMLMRALLEKAGTKEFAFLKNRIYRTDPKTDEIEDEVRLISLVLPGTPGTQNDYKDFKEIIKNGSQTELKDDNRFKSNYKCLLNKLNKWWEENSPERREEFIFFLRDKVMLLPMLCESQDDALTLFETINDRGKSLSAADIFKAKMYQAADESDRLQFIGKWGELDNHLDLFRIYMHILKARVEASTGDFCGKRSELKSYIIDECFKKGVLKNEWKVIMHSLELCHLYKTEVDWAGDKDFSDKESIYWGILKKYPNLNWQYPLFVFMHKYAVLQNNNLVLLDDRKKEYLVLLEETVRFFFIKGVVWNTIESVRNITHKICVDIEKEGDYLAIYRSESQEDLEKFKEKLNNSDLRRCKNGMVFLNSFLNPNQNQRDYATAILSNMDVEHILPQKWYKYYPEWKEEDHKKSLEKIGNLMALERKTNIKASNEFFGIKQENYKKLSKIQDALDLSKQAPHWHPKDLEKRQKESLKRLKDFFRSKKSS